MTNAPPQTPATIDRFEIYWTEKPFLDGDSAIDDIILQLEMLAERTERAIARSLEPVATAAGHDAQLTDAYRNVTHATRESTVGYVLPPGSSSDEDAIAMLAQARAEGLNPGHVDYEPVQSDDENIDMVVQSMTDYSLHLNLRDASAEPFVWNAVASHVGQAEQAVHTAILRYFKE